jgi:hypothetical protein
LGKLTPSEAIGWFSKQGKGVDMSAASDAKRMLVENLNSFGDEKTQPEKYNLYLALIYLTASVEQIQQDLEQIKMLLKSKR